MQSVSVQWLYMIIQVTQSDYTDNSCMGNNQMILNYMYNG